MQIAQKTSDSEQILCKHTILTQRKNGATMELPQGKARSIPDKTVLSSSETHVAAKQANESIDTVDKED